VVYIFKHSDRNELIFFRSFQKRFSLWQKKSRCGADTETD